MIWSAVYLATIVAVNAAFAWRPDLNALWSIAVGSIFVTRDMAQRSIGHRVLIVMGVGVVLSYFLASPFVALASAAAFACSEAIDWIVFTVTGRPLRDRIMWSCAASAPVDSAVFLGLVGLFAPLPFVAQIASKMIAAFAVWSGFLVHDLSQRSRSA